MRKRSKRSFVILGLTAISFAAITLAGGLWVLRSTSIAFEHLQRIHGLQMEAQSALGLRAEANAGLAEFAATRNHIFRDSYRGVSALSQRQLARLAPQLACCDHSAQKALADAQKNATTWDERVAGAIVAHPRNALPAFYGKILMDEYEYDLSKIDEMLAGEERNAATEVRGAIDGVVYLLAGLVVVASLMAATCWRIVATS